MKLKKQINPKRLKVRLLYAGAAVFLFLVFNLFHIPKPKSALQGEFEGWIAEVAPKLRNPTLDGRPLPEVSLRVNAPTQGVNLALMVGPQSDEAASARMARLLEMARETNFFSLSNSDEKTGGTVEVRSGEKQFTAYFRESDLDANAPAQGMLKLLAIYSAEAH